MAETNAGRSAHLVEMGQIGITIGQVRFLEEFVSVAFFLRQDARTSWIGLKYIRRNSRHYARY